MTYAEAVAANFRAARARRGLDQETVAARMKALGFTSWRYQTVGVAEKGKRRLTIEEIMALAWVLETSIYALMATSAEDGEVEFPSGARISGRAVSMSVLAYNNRSVTWDGEQPAFTAGEDDITAQVVIRPRALFASSPADPAFAEGDRAPSPFPAPGNPR